MAGEAGVRVLYIAGSGRSGSTLLGNILGQVDGLVSVGELRFIWERGMVEDRLCGCGQRFHECPFWTSVLVEAYGSADGADPAVAMAQQRSRSRVRHIPTLVLSSRLGRQDRRLSRSHQERLGQLYRAVARVTGATVVVDSSKLPSYGYLLDQIAGVDLRVLHLVRDPRPAAFSWSRRKALSDGAGPRYMAAQSAVRSSLLWTVWNATTDAMWGSDTDRYLRLRYEDLVAAPRRSVDEVLRFVGQPVGHGPFSTETTVTLGVTHSVAGNPNRLLQGEVSITDDDEWVSRMSTRRQALVTVLTLPLLRRYGYSLRPGRGRASPDASCKAS